jgi:O-acetyl-ADP-ribose deacetylase
MGSTDGGHLTLEAFLSAKQHRSDFEKTSDFPLYLSYLMQEHGFATNAALYSRANLTKQTFSNLFSMKKRPQLKTLLKLVFALHLSNHECKYLLKKWDYTLASQSPFNLVIRYCLDHQIYDLWDVNEALAKAGYSPIS